jgi:hypothetical protein
MKNVLIQESEETDIGLSLVALLAVQALMKLQQANHAD